LEGTGIAPAFGFLIILGRLNTAAVATGAALPPSAAAAAFTPTLPSASSSSSSNERTQDCAHNKINLTRRISVAKKKTTRPNETRRRRERMPCDATRAMLRPCCPHLVLQLARALDFLFAKLAGVEFAWETRCVGGDVVLAGAVDVVLVATVGMFNVVHAAAAYAFSKFLRQAPDREKSMNATR
jgi:hypothetical protein